MCASRSPMCPRLPHVGGVEAGEHWSGAGADGAAAFIAATSAAADGLAMRVDTLAANVDAAAAAVARASARLREIVERFEARAAELEPQLASPGVAEELLDEAQRALAEANGVVDQLRTELDGQAASLAGPTPAAPAPTAPGRVRADARAGIGRWRGLADEPALEPGRDARHWVLAT